MCLLYGICDTTANTAYVQQINIHYRELDKTLTYALETSTLTKRDRK